MLRLIGYALLVLLAAGPGRADPADVVSARATCSGSSCSFQVTIRHADTGWDHYADAWEVLAPDGTLLATRVLRHPHVREQPFTRSLRDVELPAELTRVRIRARDSVHGFGGREVVVALERGAP